MPQRQLLIALSMVTASGCYLSTDNLSGKPCSSDSDCPSTFYSCLVVRADGLKACEVNFPPKPTFKDGGISDAGSTGAGPTYCGEIKDILDRTCVSTCHGTSTLGSGDPTFRLDYYTPPAGGVPGAKDRAARIKDRTSVKKNMPPGDPMPTEAERALVAEWVDNGAPEGVGGMCAPVGDGCLDGGTISLANDLIPVWQGVCNPCHTAQTQGNLNLGNFDGGTYADLMRPTVGNCASAPQRVTPGDPNASSMKVRVSGSTCGPIMPTSGVTIPSCDVKKLEAWIQAGAPNN